MIMLDYIFLKWAWWLGIGMVFVMYGMTAGYDLGVTLYLPFIKDPLDQRVALNASGFTWDGNQSWIVFAGGGLFVVWPVVYSVALSYFYLPLALMIVAFFLRPTGYDYRGKVNSARWRRYWDWGLWLSALIPTFIFGYVLGAVLQGIPVHFEAFTHRILFDSSSHSLTSFNVLCGFASIAMVLMHGASFLFRRAVGELAQWAQICHRWSALLFAIILCLLLGYLAFKVHGYRLLVFDQMGKLPISQSTYIIDGVGEWITSYEVHPWKFFAPFLLIISWVAMVILNYLDKPRLCFYASALTVMWLIVTVGVTLFPFLIPSSAFATHSVTIWNGVANHYALNIMFILATILMIFTFVYKLLTFSVFWGGRETLSREDVQNNEKIFY